MNFPTIKHFIKTALIPVGHTMYVYGGGWDKTDTKASVEATTLGESKKWKEFYNSQTSLYNYKDYLYLSSLGLDCTGYIGWVIYNLLCTENGRHGFVYKSGVLGETLHKLGLGSITQASQVSTRHCGDIFYSSNHSHAYICVGECPDKSVVLLHASPPGVMVSGTKTPENKDSIAITIAQRFMHENFPDWFRRYPDVSRGAEYLFDYNRFRFYNVIVADPDDFTLLDPEDVLSYSI